MDMAVWCRQRRFECHSAFYLLCTNNNLDNALSQAVLQLAQFLGSDFLVHVLRFVAISFLYYGKLVLIVFEYEMNEILLAHRHWKSPKFSLNDHYHFLAYLSCRYYIEERFSLHITFRGIYSIGIDLSMRWRRWSQHIFLAYTLGGRSNKNCFK